MGLFSALKRIFGPAMNRPPIVQGTAFPALRVLDPPEMVVPEPVVVSERSSTTDDVFGVTFAIEYIDAAGVGSRRRITVHSVELDRWPGYLRAHCHERDAARTFRIDRVRCVIDLDGVIHDDAGRFFVEELGLVLPSEASPAVPTFRRTLDASQPSNAQVAASQSRVPKPPSKPGAEARAIARDGLRLLVGLSRSDGRVTKEEIAVVLEYVVARATQEGAIVNDEDRASLEPYLRRQHPRPEVLERCLAGIEAETPEAQALFLAFAVKLVQADGYPHPDEVGMLKQLAATIEGAQRAQAN